jgi:cellulose synthase/poly-beta-1,6-N-acetylglucosamine synthase-like glycosyltransferase
MLAEDRILCLDIFTKKNRNYIHKYIPDAYAYTDSVKFFYLLMK